MFSKNFIDKLTVFDKKILKLQKEIQKRKQKISENKKYKDLTYRLRAFIKNESNRVINRLIKVYKPAEIVVELLNFEGIGLSKRMNRLLSNCGLANIKAKLMCVSEDYGIKITYVNPAYTSQQCSVCYHTEKDNRKTRENFVCLCCGHKALADINAAKNIMSRAHDVWFIANPYATKESIKQHLLYKNKMFVSNSRLSKAMECKTSSLAILSE
jgi:putative transposase